MHTTTVTRPTSNASNLSIIPYFWSINASVLSCMSLHHCGSPTTRNGRADIDADRNLLLLTNFTGIRQDSMLNLTTAEACYADQASTSSTEESHNTFRKEQEKVWYYSKEQNKYSLE